MTTKVSPTISNIVRVDMDAPELATRLADHIEASNDLLEVTQVTMYRKQGQAYLLIRSMIKDTQAIAKIEEIVKTFKA